MWSKGRPPIVSRETFWDDVVPDLERRWERHCFCRNTHFLKLISFDFRTYNIAPTALLDSECLISRIIWGRFEPVRGWSPNAPGSWRVDRCPQCGTEFRSHAEQFSINMDMSVATPLVPLEMAAVGQYAVGFQYFADRARELDKIDDFRRAATVEAFVALFEPDAG
jgi:hypothetical protein